ncbi:MAG TPA: FtsX-like permease family protein [Kofleriaceae bacterium]|nr:FtsX-like permease family protein [Kofleriaceae bacterium]
MRFARISFKNVLRNKFRTAMTIAGITFALIAFLAVRTVVTSWESAVDHAAKDRLGTRHKVTFVMQLPKKYVDQIRQVPGVTKATWANWFGAKNPNAESEFFATMAVDAPSFIDVYKEIALDPQEIEAWKANRRGAVIGDVLARKFGWKVGDKVTLMGTIYPGDWEFEISGIYQATARSVDRSSFFFHWDYLNETLRPEDKDQVGWVASRVDDPQKVPEISKQIDKLFDEQDNQTVTMSEKAMSQSFMGFFSTILAALNVASVVILVIMMLIVGNTIAMGVRERTNEYGMMRAIGFRPGHIAGFVVAEAAFVGLLGGLVGLALGYAFVNFGLGAFLEENMGAWFPYFRVAPLTAGIALGGAVVLGAVAGLLPALRAARLDVIQSIRKIG